MDNAMRFRQKAKEQGLLLEKEHPDSQKAILKLVNGPIATVNDPTVLTELYHLAEAFSPSEADEMCELTAPLFHVSSAADAIIWTHENPLNPSHERLIHLAN
jgi:hypothetical protein